jgi:2-amino-4-hydroxy-6-hydroxymethyldihydropteridine diphosphokinase
VSSTPVAIALGSNLGDRVAHIAFAVAELSRLLNEVTVSRLIETVPVDVPDDQPPFLNAAVTGATSLDPRALLDALLTIERADGRERPYRNAPRTLDLDLILYGDGVVREEGLEVPHPRFREREFVLEPLAEIAGDWVDPVTGATVRELLEKVKREKRKAREL